MQEWDRCWISFGNEVRHPKHPKIIMQFGMVWEWGSENPFSCSCRTNDFCISRIVHSLFDKGFLTHGVKPERECCSHRQPQFREKSQLCVASWWTDCTQNKRRRWTKWTSKQAKKQRSGKAQRERQRSTPLGLCSLGHWLGSIWTCNTVQWPRDSRDGTVFRIFSPISFGKKSREGLECREDPWTRDPWWSASRLRKTPM